MIKWLKAATCALALLVCVAQPVEARHHHNHGRHFRNDRRFGLMRHENSANPTPGKPNPMKPVIELKAHILQVRNLAKGAAVGYGATWTARRDSRIAVIAAGYADGVSRAAAITEGGKPREVLVAGKRCRMVGRISMDLMALDVTDLPVSAVRRDQMVTLIGEGITLDDVAAQAGTISYELLAGLGHRFHRVWKS